MQEEGIASKPVTSSCVFPSLTGRKMSGLVGTGHVVWSGLYLVASTIGMAICVALLNVLYINPFSVTYWWYKGLLFMGCMAAGIVIFGGLVICLWQLWERKTTSPKEDFNGADYLGIKQQKEPRMDKISGQEQYVSTVRYGQRPDFGGMLISPDELLQPIWFTPLKFLPLSPTPRPSTPERCQFKYVGLDRLGPIRPIYFLDKASPVELKFGPGLAQSIVI